MFNNYSLRPMLLKEVDKPFNDNNYIYELKFDGIRALVYASKRIFKIVSRNGLDITNIYPELNDIPKIVSNDEVIFDGEIVAFYNNKPSFNKLQYRTHLKNKAKINSVSSLIPVTFVCFDILYKNKDLRDIPLIERKKILSKYIDTEYFYKSPMYDDGINLFLKVKKLGLEGVVAKKKDSLYSDGKRVNNWVKIKNWIVEEFYIHGFIFNTNKYSLLLGEYCESKLYYVGKVGVSPKRNIIKKILKEKISKNTFANYQGKAIYIKPIYKVKISYIERTPDNKLREPFLK